MNGAATAIVGLVLAVGSILLLGEGHGTGPGSKYVACGEQQYQPSASGMESFRIDPGELVLAEPDLGPGWAAFRQAASCQENVAVSRLDWLGPRNSDVTGLSSIVSHAAIMEDQARALNMNSRHRSPTDQVHASPRLGDRSEAWTDADHIYHLGVVSGNAWLHVSLNGNTNAPTTWRAGHLMEQMMIPLYRRPFPVTKLVWP